MDEGRYQWISEGVGGLNNAVWICNRRLVLLNAVDEPMGFLQKEPIIMSRIHFISRYRAFERTWGCTLKIPRLGGLRHWLGRIYPAAYQYTRIGFLLMREIGIRTKDFDVRRCFCLLKATTLKQLTFTGQDGDIMERGVHRRDAHIKTMFLACRWSRTHFDK